MFFGSPCPIFFILFNRFSLICIEFQNFSLTTSYFLNLSLDFFFFVHSVNAILWPSLMIMNHYTAFWNRFRNKNLNPNICLARNLINPFCHLAFLSHILPSLPLFFVLIDFIKLKQVVQIAHTQDFTIKRKNFFNP